jgi:PD-(D/E)XK nuclease superfamily
VSDLERLNLRDLPPVPALQDWPSRYSQTLLRHASHCQRAAYLYVKYRGGAPGVALDRGTAVHAVIERMTNTLIENGERTLFAVQEGEDPVSAAQEVASLTAAFVEEVRTERPDLTVGPGEWDAVRIQAYHWALATELDVEKVIAVERKFVLDVAGHEVSGIIDLALMDGNVGEVRDYKSSWSPPDNDEYAKGFQGRLYALLLAFGQPVEKVPCEYCDGTGKFYSRELIEEEQAQGLGGSFDPDCEGCGGRGFVERREAPIGDRLQWVRTRELYPRLLRDTGELQEPKPVVFSRTDLQDFLLDVEAIIRQLDAARESGKFPAVAGSHCSMCPAAAECPLPAHLRNYAGAINSHDQAAEAAEWAAVMGARVKAVSEEIRRWGKANGPIRWGRDQVREFVATEKRAVKRRGKRADWLGLEEAALRAAQFGEPFDLGEWVQSSVSNSFADRTLTADELAAEREQGGEREHGTADVGVDPPLAG